MFRPAEVEGRIIVPYGDSSYLWEYEKRFLQNGSDIFEDAKTRETLYEFVEARKGQTPDMKIIYDLLIVLSHGVVGGAGLRWNIRGSVGDGIDLMARVATNELVVARADGLEVLPKDQWLIPGRLMAAVEDGCEHPSRLFVRGIH